MQCPRCQTVIPAADVNLDNLVAKCRRCNEVFSFADQMPRPIQSDGQRPAKLPFPKPDSLLVEDLGDQRRIIRRWFTWPVLMLVFFCIGWDSFLIFWYFMAFNAPFPGGFNLIMVIFPIAHVAVGVGLTYFMIASLLNYTTILVNVDRLSIRHHPVPWRGNRSLDIGEIVQLYCDESYVAKNRTMNPSVTWMYNLNALLADGRKLKLLSGLPKDQALFLEQQLEEWLGIEPHPVSGELDK
jgi:hypothetical protein